MTGPIVEPDSHVLLGLSAVLVRVSEEVVTHCQLNVEQRVRVAERSVERADAVPPTVEDTRWRCVRDEDIRIAVEDAVDDGRKSSCLVSPDHSPSMYGT